MSRREANEKLTEITHVIAGKLEKGPIEEINSFYLSIIAIYAEDIAKSLAVIADSLEGGLKQ